MAKKAVEKAEPVKKDTSAPYRQAIAKAEFQKEQLEKQKLVR